LGGGWGIYPFYEGRGGGRKRKGSHAGFPCKKPTEGEKKELWLKKEKKKKGKAVVPLFYRLEGEKVEKKEKRKMVSVPSAQKENRHPFITHRKGDATTPGEKKNEKTFLWSRKEGEEQGRRGGEKKSLDPCPSTSKGGEKKKKQLEGKVRTGERKGK